MNEKWNLVERYLSNRTRYQVVVRELDPEEGGGWVAYMPELGERTFVACGETREEAEAALADLYEYLVPILIDEGEVLPEPSSPP